MLARVVAPAKQANLPEQLDAFSLVLVFGPAVVDGNPSENQARLKAAARLSGRRSGILLSIESETT
jgi:hypothetical protein